MDHKGIRFNQKVVTEECFQVAQFLPIDEQVQNISIAHPRECNRSISNTMKNGTGEFLFMHAQAKHIAFEHPRECEISISIVGTNGTCEKTV